MPLKLSYDAQADVPEAVKGAYVAKDGKFVLDVEIPDVTKLETTIEKVRKERGDFEKAARKAEGDLATATKELEALNADGVTKGQKVTDLLEKWKKDTSDQVAAAEARVRAELSPMVDKVTKYELDDVLGKAFETSGGRSEKRDRAIDAAKKDGWVLVDGKLVRKDASGQITNATTEDYFAKDLKKTDPEWYKGTQAAGGGAAGVTTGGGGGKMSYEDFSKLSPSEKMLKAREMEGTTTK